MIPFSFDGVPYQAQPGDTLAAALLRNGVKIVARGPYSDRPRGIVDIGSAEPNAFVQVGDEPMVRATTRLVYPGLTARSLAGKGFLSDAPDDTRYDKKWIHVDVLVVGGGAAGIEAARNATGRVLLVDAGPLQVEGLQYTTVTGAYDHRFLVAVERRSEKAQRLWHIRAKRVVLATGATERPILFADNDRPGIMLAGAAAAYVTRFGVRPGNRAVVFGSHDGAFASAEILSSAGIEVVAEVDTRRGDVVTGTDGDPCLTAAYVNGERIECDLLAVSGGWNPDLRLYSHAGGRPQWSDEHGAHVPGTDPDGYTYVSPLPRNGEPYWLVEPGEGREHLVYVDSHRDTTLADLRSAVGAGMTSNEHVKRYTTAGTGADQATSTGVVGAGILGQTTTTARPPVEPIPFALLAGRDRGPLLDPARRTPMHEWHEANGALWEDVGQWKRPWYYPRDGEDLHRAVRRECREARENVAMMDVSTLGKIDLQGPDVGELLDRLYVNRFSNLHVGHCRYGVMCRPDGTILDDGVTARIGEQRWHLTTTTGNAATVLDWIEEWLQTEWPDLRVAATPVTDQWAAVAVVGPRSRDVMKPFLDRELPFMRYAETTVHGIPARVFRISFTGELSYEINVPAWYGAALWERLAAEGITPYGTETMHVLRAEKGFIVVGQDTDGTVTADDAGLGWARSKVKHYVGERAYRRADPKQLVGLLPADPESTVDEGAQLVAEPAGTAMLGHVTSSYHSAALGRSFALAMVQNGRARTGETLYAVSNGRTDPVLVTAPVFYDPEGVRRDG
jgi:sarcosine oxidase subunit alpha